jgi:GntR family transcriptional regulator
VLDRASPVPLYHQLKQALAMRLKNGEFELGLPLPTEAELMRFYDISRITVRRAMLELEREGHIVRMPGKGTFVTEPKIDRGLTRLTSFTEDMRERGLTATSELLDLRQESAPVHVAEKLGIEAGTPVWFVHRLRLANQQPIALNLSYLRLPPHISVVASELADSGSLWALLESKGIALKDADKTLEAILADQEYADLLQVPEGAPLLLVEGVVYDHHHTPIEFSQVVNRGDRYKYTLYLKR